MNPPLVLVGLRGSGKTTVGRLVAEQAGKPFEDTDALVERVSGLTVLDIFTTRGEAAFRALEAQVVARLTSRPWDGVLATGGGVVLARENRRRLQAWGLVVFLDAPVEVLAARIRDSIRPSLTGRRPWEELETLERDRRALYEAVAQVRVDASRPAAVVAGELLAMWKSRWE